MEDTRAYAGISWWCLVAGLIVLRSSLPCCLSLMNQREGIYSTTALSIQPTDTLHLIDQQKAYPLVAVLQDRYYVTKEYMREVLEHMSIAQLIDTILINPTVHLSPSYRDTGLSATYTFKPLSNLVYTRDQQARGSAGVRTVAGREVRSSISQQHPAPCVFQTCQNIVKSFIP